MTARSASWFLLSLLLSVGVPARAQQKSKDLQLAALPIYPDSTRGLEKLFKDLLAETKHGDKQALALHLDSFVLPGPDAWFKSVFGEARGDYLARGYERTRLDFPLAIPDVLSQVIRDKMTHVSAVRFTDSCDPAATRWEYPILILRQRPEPLYDVRFEGASLAAQAMSFFAYVDGAFRYIGNLRMKTPEPSFARGKRRRGAQLHVSAKVQQARLIHREDPIYPSKAYSFHLEGSVILHVIIGRDGAVRDLQVLEGRCWFAQAAIKAVRKWRYRPTLLNGQPVKVNTTITVIFKLGP